MSLRDERADAIRKRYRELSDDFTRTLPLLLDDLENIDEAHVPDGIIKFDIGEAGPMTGPPMTDEEKRAFAEKWRAANPAIGTRVKAEAVTASTEQAATPARPAPRRRTARKDGI